MAFPLVLLYLLRRILKDRVYLQHLQERFGILRPSWHRTAHGAIWLHCVSVGEAISAVPLVSELRSRYPYAPVYVSTSTLAGREICEEKLKDLAAGVFFIPMDYRLFVRRVLFALRPTLVVVFETEIWPNLYREAKRYNCTLAIVNGRISDKTFPTYTKFAWFFKTVLQFPDRIYAQSAQDRERYIALGAPADRVEDFGNLKFDFNPSSKGVASEIRELVDAAKPSSIWIAASTMPPMEAGDVDEDDAVLDAFEALREKHPRLLLILVPRKPERFNAAAAKLGSRGIPFVRRSKLQPMELPGVLLLDSMGELGALFAIADVVFMGGTLPKRGGHNLLEPAFFGKPVIVGPHNQNFAQIHREFSDQQALVQIQDASELATAVERLVDDSKLREEIGERARAIAVSKRGVTSRAVDRLLEAYFDAVPTSPRWILTTIALWPLSKIWGAFARDGKDAKSLSKPVISIGGITMGGAGKTPMAVWLSSKLRQQGLRPAILTRGYRRRTPHVSIVIPEGQRANTDLTGDEAQIYVRRRLADVGIGASRYETGKRLLQQCKPDVLVLDDGFQHRMLARNIDIVLIDSLDPFGGSNVFPLGRLREPAEQLRRADIFVLTRVEPNQRTNGIERELRRWNEKAPIFRSRVLFKNWQGGQPCGRVAAFCGLANPRTFWRTLEGLGVYARRRWEFEDHHYYTPAEAAKIAWQAREAGFRYVVTTEKDFMNLSEYALAEFEGLELCWLEIDVEIEDERGLLREIDSRLEAVSK
jgi:3-deoxy-D-manno-octulosonic-acid transferase